MKGRLLLLCIAVAGMAGLVSCRTAPKKNPSAEDKPAAAAAPLQIAGEILHVNPTYQYVVIRCAVLPSGVEEAKVYREQTGVGRVRLTGPAHPPFVIADIVDGSPRVGDRVGK